MKKKITIQEAREIVAEMDFGPLPATWTLDLEKVAHAYKSFAPKRFPRNRCEFILYYLHRYRVRVRRPGHDADKK